MSATADQPTFTHPRTRVLAVGGHETRHADQIRLAGEALGTGAARRGAA